SLYCSNVLLTDEPAIRRGDGAIAVEHGQDELVEVAIVVDPRHLRLIDRGGERERKQRCRETCHEQREHTSHRWRASQGAEPRTQIRHARGTVNLSEFLTGARGGGGQNR